MYLYFGMALDTSLHHEFIQHRKMFRNIFEIALILAFHNYSWALQCVDHNNNPVDWYVIYKLPRKHNANPFIAQGAAYTYVTANDVDGWKLADISINDTDSLVGLTLEPLFKKSDNNLHVLYNDERPDGSVNFKKGHTKGLILGNEDGGIWLVHSVPHFPPIDAGEYYFPDNGYRYGQSFLCISFDMENLDKIGLQLQYNLPNSFSQNIPSNLRSLVPNLAKAVDKVTVKSAPWFHLGRLKSQAGLTFLSFAKSPKFGKELYADWVAPTLKANLFVETWRNGPGRISSDCGQSYDVYNVKSVSISAANFTFKSTADHSKWAVASEDNSESKWVCIGDINRAKSQRRRGGGTVCFASAKLAETYQESVADTEAC